MSRWAARLLLAAAVAALCLGALRVTRAGRARRLFARCESRLGTGAWTAACDRTGLYLSCRCLPRGSDRGHPGEHRLPRYDRRQPPERNWWDAHERPPDKFPVKHAAAPFCAEVRIRGPPRQC